MKDPVAAAIIASAVGLASITVVGLISVVAFFTAFDVDNSIATKGAGDQ